MGLMVDTNVFIGFVLTMAVNSGFDDRSEKQ